MRETEGYSRRKFIGKGLARAITSLGAVIAIQACGSNNEVTEKKKNGDSKAGSCDDLSDVSAEELDKRKAMGYVSKSEVPGSSCASCGLFIPSPNDVHCGKCMLFKGPVKAEGYCVQYAAKTT